MRRFNHNAIHEAGHVIAALSCELDVEAVLIKPTAKYAARCVFDPTKTAPKAVYVLKIAGMTAVQIHNEKYGRTDDDGFGRPDDPESDAYTVECLRLYWMALGMTEDDVMACENKLRNFVRRMLLHHWPTIEALAIDIAIQKLSEETLTAKQIGKVVKTLDPTFYKRIEAHLLI